MTDGPFVLRVDGPFSPDRSSWPETPALTMNNDNGIVLALFLNAPNRREIAAVESGKMRFAWVVHGALGFLLFKFGDAPWSDVPYTPHRLTEPFDLEPYPRGTHRRVLAFVVHAKTGTIAAMRAFSWPAYFHNTIVESVRQLEAQPYAQPEADADQAAFYRRYPDGPSLYRLTRDLPAEAKCNGGQREDKPN